MGLSRTEGICACRACQRGSRSGNYGRQGHGREETPGAEGSLVQKKNNSRLLGNGTDAKQEHGANPVPGLLLGSPCVPQCPCPAWAETQLCTQRA